MEKVFKITAKTVSSEVFYVEAESEEEAIAAVENAECNDPQTMIREFDIISVEIDQGFPQKST